MLRKKKRNKAKQPMQDLILEELKQDPLIQDMAASVRMSGHSEHETRADPDFPAQANARYRAKGGGTLPARADAVPTAVIELAFQPMEVCDVVILWRGEPPGRLWHMAGINQYHIAMHMRRVAAREYRISTDEITMRLFPANANWKGRGVAERTDTGQPLAVYGYNLAAPVESLLGRWGLPDYAG
ncbi:hypothetical protein [Saccharopolyspora taberi]|uniref:Uncharacterized protein n=1 Tax=Saccharopolyspora taberi TaxID=60895 RepID=A0ABN3V844_9PSEU